MMKYESGEAESEAAGVSGRYAEPWLNVIEAYEPGALRLVQRAICDPHLRPLFRGRVVDLGAGTCWTTALMSQLASVDEVVAVDLSAGFFRRVSCKVIQELGGAPQKIVFVAGSFEEVPYPDDAFDVALLVASLHHAVAPLRLLSEARRLLRPGGTLFLVENPAAVLRIGAARRRSVQLTAQTGATEIAYTRGELEYMLAMGGFSSRRWVRDEVLSANPIKKAVRLFLRFAGVEDLFLSVGYAIVAVAMK